jgi:diguanylate cyclase (GGDEF)-like protein
MWKPRVLKIALFAIALAVALDAAALPDRSKLLDEAEQMRKTDKPRSRAILDEVNRSLATSPDPLVYAHAQLLECTWADEPAVAFKAVEAGLAAAQRAGSLKLRAQLIACRANALQYADRVTEAERDYFEAAKLASQVGDSSTVADARMNGGYLQYTRGAMADALANLQYAYRIDEQTGREPQRLVALTIIANIYADAKVAQYDRAIEYYKQLLAAYEKRGDQGDIADTLYNIGGTYETKGDLVAAELHYRRALATFISLDRPVDIAFTRRSLGSCLTKLGKPEEALKQLDEALRYYETEDAEQDVAMARQYRGIALRRMKRSEESLRDLAVARAYFEREKNPRFLERNAAEMALAYAQLGNWREAYEAMRRYADITTELAASRRDEASSRLRVEFDAAKKEQENRALARENALRGEALREAERGRRLQRIVIALTALLAAALALLFWRQIADTRRMRVMALTDELTRLPNRRHILALAEEAFASAKDSSSPLATIAFDIDRFKRINDTWGHHAGDVILSGVARTCRFTLRPGDAIGRTGGEEFLVILRDTNAAQAIEIAERLRAAVERTDFSSVEPGLRVTISLGVVTLSQHDSFDAMAKDADELLYRAKEGGRNRVETAA